MGYQRDADAANAAIPGLNDLGAGGAGNFHGVVRASRVDDHDLIRECNTFQAGP